jgi:hypothetical protein
VKDDFMALELVQLAQVQLSAQLDGEFASLRRYL